MEAALFVLVFAVLWETSEAIQCYRCIPERQYDKKDVPLCEGFNYSQRYIIDCPHSTGCIKKDTQLLSLGVTTKSTERDCAHQTMSGDQKKVNGRWEPADTIYDVYEVGCKDNTNQFNKATKATECFCRGDLCNAAVKLNRSGIALVTTATLWALLR